METILSKNLLIIYLVIFAFIMILATLLFDKSKDRSNNSFLVANRNVPWWLGGTSIAASWTWSIALMVSVQLAFEHGIAGLFWFTIPNFIAVIIFIWLGPKIRNAFPEGYSLPQWMNKKYNDKIITRLYLFVFYYYQIMAATMQIYAGAVLLSVASGIPATVLMPILLVIVLAYITISGLKASMITDFIQLGLMLFIGVGISIIVAIKSNFNFTFSGILENGSSNPLSKQFLLSGGIIMTISLLSASIGDQQFWQRSFAIKKGHLKKSFIWGGILFAMIPISLGFIGFSGANIVNQLNLPEGMDMSLIGFIIVKNLLPSGLATIFLFVLLSGLASTLDSSLSASSSLFIPNNELKNIGKTSKTTITNRRLAMLIVGVIGLILGYIVELTGFGLKYLWWSLNTLTAAIVVPTLLSLYWKKVTPKGIKLGSLLAIIIGLPIFVYGSIKSNDNLLALAYIVIPLTSLLLCYLFRRKND